MKYLINENAAITTVNWEERMGNISIDQFAIDNNFQVVDSSQEDLTIEDFILDNGLYKLRVELYDVRKDKIISEALIKEAYSYLSNTDWYVTRFIETQKEIPQDVTDGRAQAREQIDLLRTKL